MQSRWYVPVTHYLLYCRTVLRHSDGTLRRCEHCLKNHLLRVKSLDKENAYSLFSDYKGTDGTINKMISIITLYMRYLEEEHGLDTKEFVNALTKCRIRAPQEQVREILTPEELRLILTPEPNNQRDLKYSLVFSVQFHTGARVQEVLNLTWQNVNLTEKYVLYTKTKTKRDRKVSLPEYLCELLLNYSPSHKPSDLLFQVSQQKLNKYLKEKAERHGITKRVHSHIFRHSFISLMAHDNAPLSVITSMVGHKGMSTISQYLSVASVEKQRQIQDRHNPLLQQHNSPKDWLDSEEKRLRERDIDKVQNIKHSITRDGNKLIYEVWF